MTYSDPTSDFIIRIKNAGAAGKPVVTVSYSKMNMNIAELLKKEEYVESVERHGRKVQKTIEIGIKYEEERMPRVQGVKRISKPSRRVYLRADEIRPVRQGHGLLVLSTPEGIMTGSEAQKRSVGGEALFEIW